MTAALAQLPSTLDELLRLLGDACAMCGEETVREQEDDGAGRVLPLVRQRPRGAAGCASRCRLRLAHVELRRGR